MNRMRCPICDRWLEAADPKALPDFPFCSRRCRLIDLGRWLGEEYGIACADGEGEPAEENDGRTIP